MKIDINGPIVSNDDKWIYNYFEMDATCENDVKKQLEKAPHTEDIEININSPGGDLFAGSQIYTMLKKTKNKILVNVTGLAASAASIIAMSGNIISMAPTAMMMIHRVSVSTQGNSNNLKHELEVLDQADKGVASAYALRTNKDIREVIELMNKETWFNAESAVEAGFADRIMFFESTENKQDFVFINSYNNGLLPEAIKNKAKELKMKEKANLQNRLNKLKTEEN